MFVIHIQVHITHCIMCIYTTCSCTCGIKWYDGIKQREPQGSVHSREAPVRIAFLSLSSHDLSKKEESLHSQVCQSV